jgi:hypothetical protein
MVLVRASDLPHRSHHKKHGKKGHHRRPRKSNPGDGHSHMKEGAKSLAFGALAAVAGIAGAFALAKAAPKGRGVQVASNLLAAGLVGGAVGMVDRAAGTVVAHNYVVAASQLALGDGSGKYAARAMPASAARVAFPVATPRVLASARPVHGLSDDVGEAVEGIVADNLGAAEDVDGFEKLQGVIADNMGSADDGFGAPEDVEGFERMEGIVADNLGAYDDMGAPDDDFFHGFADDVGEVED